MHSALKSLILTARQYGTDLSTEELQNNYSLGETEADDQLLVRIAQDHNLKARHIQLSWKKFSRSHTLFPVIARLKDQRCVVITGYRKADPKKNRDEHLLVVDPNAPQARLEEIPPHAFQQLWNGTLILIQKDFRLTDESQPFSFRWLFGGLARQKSLIIGLVMISLILHCFAVLPAIFIMIVLDKVVNFQATATLYVITIGVMVAYIFNGILGYIRQYIVLFTTSKIDVRLNNQAFNRLLNLPLNFFKKHAPSQLQKTMQQTSTLRQVLTQKFFSAILDTTAVFVFLPILYFYSPLLCGVVLLFTLFISLNLYFSSGRQKKKLRLANQ
ncbi:ABC transporter transmembrane domain-containing protein, partial [Magnetococcales bacterium HHB-1]